MNTEQCIYIGGPLHGQRTILHNDKIPFVVDDTTYHYLKLTDAINIHVYCEQSLANDADAFEQSMRQLRADGLL